ncbi:MAG: PIN domain-containing protein [Acidobacteria bacterium]|nr:MAG: PIN domain-containing protein [Acidobacteriota bacterium]
MDSPVLVVLDTNVLIAAGFNPKSNSARLVQAVRTGQIRMVWNEAIRREYRATIDRIPMLDWFAFQDMMTPDSRDDSADLSDAGLEPIVDPEDRKFAALARATGAILVTSDDHLLSVRDQLNLIIRTPAELIKSLGLAPPL